MLYAAAGVFYLVRPHRRVTNENQFVIAAIGVNDVFYFNLLSITAFIITPDTFIHAVVEVKKLQMLKLGFNRRKQLLTLFNVVIHRATHIEKHQ